MIPTNAVLKLDKAGKDFIKQFEGLRLNAYYCSAGKLTIGYGHTGNVQPMTRISQEQADSLFDADIAVFEAAVSRLVTVPLSQNQFNSLVSFAYNVGIGAFERSTLLKRLNGGSYHSVPEELKKWDKANGKPVKGLTRRRAKEGELWLD